MGSRVFMGSVSSLPEGCVTVFDRGTGTRGWIGEVRDHRSQHFTLQPEVTMPFMSTSWKRRGLFPLPTNILMSLSTFRGSLRNHL